MGLNDEREKAHQAVAWLTYADVGSKAHNAAFEYVVGLADENQRLREENQRLKAALPPGTPSLPDFSEMPRD